MIMKKLKNVSELNKEKRMARLTLSAPWVIYYRQLDALFSRDEEVKVIFDEDNNEIRLYVDNGSKADALTQLLPVEKEFGNYTLKITVIPGNDVLMAKGSLVEAAFEGNRAFAYSETVQLGTNTMTFIVFIKEVVQYYTDNLGDIHGIHSTLYQDLAEEIFDHIDGVYYCTDVEDYDLAIPHFGEWP